MNQYSRLARRMLRKRCVAVARNSLSLKQPCARAGVTRAGPYKRPCIIISLIATPRRKKESFPEAPFSPGLPCNLQRWLIMSGCIQIQRLSLYSIWNSTSFERRLSRCRWSLLPLSNARSTCISLGGRLKLYMWRRLVLRIFLVTFLKQPQSLDFKKTTKMLMKKLVMPKKFITRFKTTK